MKLYFLTGLPTETDEDTLGIAELARNCVAVGQALHQPGLGDGVSVGGFVPEAAHAVPVVRPEHRGRAAAQDRAPARRHRQGHAACSSSGTTRGRRWSRASPAGATGASARVIERVWRARRHVPGVERARSTSPAGRRPWRPRACRSTGTSTAIATEHEVLPVGPPLGRAAQGLPLAGLAGARWPRSGVEDCRWTPCYDCGVCTGYGLEHVVASPVPPAGGSQGTGQDLASGAARCRCGCWPAPRAGGRHERSWRGPGCASPSSARCAGRATATWPACGSGRCGGPRCPSPTPRASRPGPQLSLRAGPARPGTSRSPSTSTSTSPRHTGRRRRRCRPRLTPALPRRHRRAWPRRRRSTAPSRRSSRPSPPARGEIELRRPRTATEAADGRGGRPRRRRAWSPTRTRKGHEVTDDLRPAILAPRCHRPSRTRTGSVPHGRPGHPAPRRCVRASCSRRASRRRRSTAGCCAPTNGSSTTARAGSRSRSTRRRPRTRSERAHEKGSLR